MKKIFDFTRYEGKDIKKYSCLGFATVLGDVKAVSVLDGCNKIVLVPIDDVNIEPTPW